MLAWSEGPEANDLHPRGIRGAVADALHGHADVRTACLVDPEQGVDLRGVDVLAWWGHAHHADLDDARAEQIANAVRGGMGLLVLHSGHHSKPFRALLNASGNLGGWREAAEVERLWIVNSTHPIAAGLPNPIEIPHEEMYAEPFDVPPPDDLVFVSWFAGGEIFRSGAGWRRGAGKIFYFRPGHEAYPTLHHEHVRHVLQNAARWCAPEAP